MKSFFTSLLYASVIGGIGAALAGKAYRKYIQSLAALLCTTVIISPLIELIPSFNIGEAPDTDISIDQSAYNSLIMKQSKEDIEAAVDNYIFSETGIKPLAISIDIESEQEDISIKAIRVKTKSKSEAVTVKSLLEQEFKQCIAEVVCED